MARNSADSVVEAEKARVLPGQETLSRLQLVGAAKAAALLDLSLSTIYDYAKKGILPSVKIGKHPRFRLSDLERHLEKLRKEAQRG